MNTYRATAVSGMYKHTVQSFFFFDQRDLFLLSVVCHKSGRLVSFRKTSFRCMLRLYMVNDTPSYNENNHDMIRVSSLLVNPSTTCRYEDSRLRRVSSLVNPSTTSRYDDSRSHGDLFHREFKRLTPPYPAEVRKKTLFTLPEYKMPRTDNSGFSALPPKTFRLIFSFVLSPVVFPCFCLSLPL